MILLTKKKDYDHAIKVATIKAAILGIIIGLAWGFCTGILFEKYLQKPKLPVLIIMKGVEF